MNVKFGLMTGAAIACAVFAGCKAPKAHTAAEPVSAPRPAKTAPAAAQPAPEVKSTPAKPVEEPRCKCAPGTMHDSACLCGASDCKCKVRPPEPEYTTYRVKSGDTLSGICVRYALRQSKVLEINPGMNADKLYAGAKIKLPGVISLKEEDSRNVKAAAAKPVAKPVTRTSAKAATYAGATKLYTVQSGDSLGKIAYANGITVKCLKEMNGLKKDMIRIGQKIKVPAKKVVAKTAKSTAPVTAEKKTAAASAAEAAATPAAAETPAAPVSEAVEAPAAEAAPVESPAAEVAVSAEPEPVSALTHTVKEGEDTVSIAIHYNVSPSAIMDLNDLKNTDTLKPGQVLKLPANAKAQ